MNQRSIYTSLALAIIVLTTSFKYAPDIDLKSIPKDGQKELSLPTTNTQQNLFTKTEIVAIGSNALHKFPSFPTIKIQITGNKLPGFSFFIGANTVEKIFLIKSFLSKKLLASIFPHHTFW